MSGFRSNSFQDAGKVKIVVLLAVAAAAAVADVFVHINMLHTSSRRRGLQCVSDPVWMLDAVVDDCGGGRWQAECC